MDWTRRDLIVLRRIVIVAHGHNRTGRPRMGSGRAQRTQGRTVPLAAERCRPAAAKYCYSAVVCIHSIDVLSDLSAFALSGWPFVSHWDFWIRLYVLCFPFGSATCAGEGYVVVFLHLVRGTYFCFLSPRVSASADPCRILSDCWSVCGAFRFRFYSCCSRIVVSQTCCCLCSRCGLERPSFRG